MSRVEERLARQRAEENTTEGFSGATPVGILSYPELFKPSSFEGGPEYFSCHLLFDADDPGIAKLKKLAERCARAKWSDRLPATLRSPFRDGTERANSDDRYEVYRDKVYITFRSTRKPRVVDINLEDVAEMDIRAGDKCRVSFSAYAYDKAGNRGVSFGLNSVQLVAKGKPLAGGGDGVSAFAADEINPEDYVDYDEDQTAF